jgi:pyridoxine 4-dehydrogenase
MQEIADGHTAATPAQVALNWARAKGTIPIPGARTLQQVQSNYGALQWSLSEGEVKALDLVAAKVQTFNQPQDNPFPTMDKNTGLRMYDS